MKMIRKKKPIIFSEFDTFLKEEHYPLWVAINHHRTHKNAKMTLRKHTYLKEILMDIANKIVIKKSTQGGVSEYLIIISRAAAYKGAVVFYVLPTDGLKNRFVTNRFEKSQNYTPYYMEQVSQKQDSKLVKKTIITNQSLKDIGEGVINFVGSKSDVPFVEIPADWLIVDEADKCDPNRLEMALERLGHSNDPHEIYVGNPTYVGSFLHNKYEESTKSRFAIQCNHCGKFVMIDFFNHVVRQVSENDFVIRDKEFEFNSGKDLYPICDNPKCNKPFDRYGNGTYIPEQKSDISGKHVSRLFSGNDSLVQIVHKFSRALGNPYKLQRFYNSELGESYTADGSKVTLENILNNKQDYFMPTFPTSLISGEESICILGADVGNEIHIRVNQILTNGKKRAVYIGKVVNANELFSIAARFAVRAAVIDALPEIRLARTFSHTASGYFRCTFGTDKMDSINPKEKTITVSRTGLLDEVKEKIVKNEILFPQNIQAFQEYIDHMQEPTRVWDEDRKVYSWLSNRADHFFFAEAYCLLAERILMFIKN